MIKILAINPGSTSTKIAVFHNSKPVFLKSINHPQELLVKFDSLTEQFIYRKDAVIAELQTAQINITRIQAVVGRGGLLRPIKSGVYRINNALLKDLQYSPFGIHASNLGGLIAYDIANTIPKCQSFIADPAVVDEMENIARVAGHPLFKRRSIFLAFTHKATGRAYARLVNRKYEDMNLVIAHMGGGISVAAHKKGRVIDVNQALNGEGPFSPERSGTLPMADLVHLCFSGDKNKEEILELIQGKGGYMAYFGTSNAYEIELMAEEGNEQARFIQDAMAYQVGKEISAMASVLYGELDAIILTGGISYNPMVVEFIKKMTSFIAPVVIYPGEDEMHALAWNGLMVLKGEIEAKEYDESNMVQYPVQFKD